MTLKLFDEPCSCFEVQNPSSNAIGGGPSQLGVPNPRMIKMSEHPNKQRI